LRRLGDLLPPPRRHLHRYCGALAPRTRLRAAVTANAGTVLQILETAPRGDVWSDRLIPAGTTLRFHRFPVNGTPFTPYLSLGLEKVRIGFKSTMGK
jgi:hypothetical protein